MGENEGDAGSLDIKDEEEGDEFFVQSNKIWMPAQSAEANDDAGEGRLRNGKKDVGSIFYLEKIAKDKQQIREVKMESLNEMGNDILDFYEAGNANNANGESEVPADEDTPILAESKLSHKSQLKQVIYELIES